MNIVRASSKAVVWAGLWGLVCAAGPVVAQGVPYKVTAPDGSVTYTDRPAADARSVRSLGAASAPSPAESGWLEGLPFTLRQVALRFPVTLYTAAGCAPCDQGRQVLQQRGVPFKEFKVEAGAGSELRRREGTDNLPVLRVGQQQLLGFEAGEWRQTLNAAGYPANNALPAGWQAPAVQSLSPPTSKSPTADERLVPAPRVLTEPAEPSPPAKRFRF
jgi:glutaredoxin